MNLLHIHYFVASIMLILLTLAISWLALSIRKKFQRRCKTCGTIWMKKTAHYLRPTMDPSYTARLANGVWHDTFTFRRCRNGHLNPKTDTRAVSRRSLAFKRKHYPMQFIRAFEVEELMQEAGWDKPGMALRKEKPPFLTAGTAAIQEAHRLPLVRKDSKPLPFAFAQTR